jgi:hypothetical protein
MAEVALLDTVALLRDVPEHRLVRGQVGAVVDDAGGEAVMVEFVDDDGSTVATPHLRRADLLVLKFAPLLAAE